MMQVMQQQAPAENGTASSLKRYQIIGFVLLFSLTIGLGGWAAFASISGAVIASGQVVVESNSKKVQHLEGGIIAEILAKEGMSVIAGQVLVRLDDTETRARLTILNTQIYELLAKQGRLEAERDGVAAIEFAPELTSRAIDNGVARIIKGQTRLFESRRDTLSGQKQQLQKRIEQQNEEIVGLQSQQVAKEKQTVLIKKELKDLIGLNKQGLVPTTRVLALQREAASLEGTSGELVAKVARIKGRISETELQLLQLDQDTRTEVLNELRQVQTQLSELIEKRVAAEAQLKRIDIVAPQSGYVHQLDVHTVGGVIGSGQDLMTIVPQDDRMVLEARLDPRDIDQVLPGALAKVRFSSFDQRTTPELEGTVERVAADLSQDQATGQQYYTVRVELNEVERAKLGKNKLVPGMPAEVFIPTGARTPLNYLLKPLTDQVSRAFREG